MSNPHNRETGGSNPGSQLELMRKLGQYKLVMIGNDSLGIVDPNDLIEDGEPRLLGSIDVSQERGLDELFRVLVGPSLFALGDQDNPFVQQDDTK